MRRPRRALAADRTSPIGLDVTAVAPQRMRPTPTTHPKEKNNAVEAAQGALRRDRVLVTRRHRFRGAIESSSWARGLSSAVARSTSSVAVVQLLSPRQAASAAIRDIVNISSMDGIWVELAREGSYRVQHSRSSGPPRRIANLSLSGNRAIACGPSWSSLGSFRTGIEQRQRAFRRANRGVRGPRQVWSFRKMIRRFS